jgi:hypothetical protein
MSSRGVLPQDGSYPAEPQSATPLLSRDKPPPTAIDSFLQNPHLTAVLALSLCVAILLASSLGVSWIVAGFGGATASLAPFQQCETTTSTSCSTRIATGGSGDADVSFVFGCALSNVCTLALNLLLVLLSLLRLLAPGSRGAAQCSTRNALLSLSLLTTLALFCTAFAASVRASSLTTLLRVVGTSSVAAGVYLTCVASALSLLTTLAASGLPRDVFILEEVEEEDEEVVIAPPKKRQAWLPAFQMPSIDFSPPPPSIPPAYTAAPTERYEPSFAQRPVQQRPAPPPPIPQAKMPTFMSGAVADVSGGTVAIPFFGSANGNASNASQKMQTLQKRLGPIVGATAGDVASLEDTMYVLKRVLAAIERVSADLKLELDDVQFNQCAVDFLRGVFSRFQVANAERWIVQIEDHLNGLN